MTKAKLMVPCHSNSAHQLVEEGLNNFGLKGKQPRQKSTPAWITSKESPQRDTCRLPIGPLPLSSRPLFNSLISFSIPSRDRSLFTSFKRITY
ncbi:hypothetical protein LWI29_020560 [Acer saccharum]|uniref:Uncharacterized protein n=1 Tax=Acer saccharum TaxID=4024 RepID=A0AA39S5S5_ACESA|nr:hypothetical protein LWI29_020560 [Acer saccharum]